MKLIRKVRIITLFIHLALCMISYTCTEIKSESRSYSQNKVHNQAMLTEKINLRDGIFMDSKMLKNRISKYNLENRKVRTYVSTEEPQDKKEETPLAANAALKQATPPPSFPTDPTKKQEIPGQGSALQALTKEQTKTQSIANVATQSPTGDCNSSAAKVGINTNMSNISSAGFGTINANGTPVDSSSPLLFEGWVKYFKFPEQGSRFLQKKFFKNGEYFEQMKYLPGVNYSEKNAAGDYNYIRSDDFFYLISFKSIVSFFSSKQVIIININTQ